MSLCIINKVPLHEECCLIRVLLPTRDHVSGSYFSKLVISCLNSFITSTLPASLLSVLFVVYAPADVDTVDL